MVETRENSPSKRKLSLLDFSKVASLIGMGATFLTACQEVGVMPVHAQEPNDTQPPETAMEPSPVIEATPTSENAPAAFTENLPALEAMGFSLRQGERGWELVDTNGIVAFASADALTITAYGKNGELIVVPEQRFGITGTQGLGMEQIVTLKNEQGVNEYMYLEAGYSVPIQEQYDNFEDLENCPRVDLSALWDGTLAHSEAINAKEFPEGTIAPDGFGFNLWKGAQTFSVLLSDVVKGVIDNTISYKTYHRRYISCYRSTTPEGVEVIIGTEQVLMPDNKTSFFLHYVFGWEDWARGQDFSYGGSILNLSSSVFLAYIQPPTEGHDSVQMRPVVFMDSYDPNLDWHFNSMTGKPNPVEELYQLPQNYPASKFPGLEELARTREPSISQVEFLDWADTTAVKNLQNMGLYASWRPGFKANQDTFFAKQN